jgi:hypothetical protein
LTATNNASPTTNRANRKTEPMDAVTKLSETKTKCDPRCGAGCTQAAYDKATREAAQLCSRLGPGWKPVVHDNLGWHYHAQNGIVRIYPRTIGSHVSGQWEKPHSYWCSINASKQFHATAENPEAAFREALLQMRSVFDELVASFDFVEQLRAGFPILPDAQ